jgi:hypothetical protein
MIGALLTSSSEASPCVEVPAGVDLLSQAIQHVQPHLRRDLPLRARVRAFWAGCAAAADLAAVDQVEADFLAVAYSTGLAADVGAHADEDLRHVIGWALRGGDPFGAQS